ncbi:MAG TPA: hypothetical protein DCL54_11025 [Alphaproteobacteria bacterium]|nr:hypothetical protein [Alphaproteobacteria bacterium]HAJ47101.1 hypothetical protein [Alphaproteobacteria bacterium]
MKMEKSSGNVFADLGLPDSGELLPKAKLAHRIGVLIRERGLTQAQAASCSNSISRFYITRSISD